MASASARTSAGSRRASSAPTRARNGPTPSLIPSIIPPPRPGTGRPWILPGGRGQGPGLLLPAGEYIELVQDKGPVVDLVLDQVEQHAADRLLPAVTERAPLAQHRF